MSWIRGAWAWIIGRFRPRAKARPWATEFADAAPVRARRETVYLLGEGEHLWSAAFLCPCGCGDLIQLNLLPEARPHWTVIRHEGGTVSVSPSVWRVVGCRSHFFLRRGRIEWC